MTTHERRVMALMRFHGLSKAEAEKRARSLAAKKNPVKRKTQARTQSAAEDYVYRQSQVTKKAPSKRLIKRRAINLQTQRGVFPNPAKREKQIIVEYELSGQNFAKRNRGMYGWKELAAFPDTPEGSENAIQYAQAYHKIAPHLRIQVVTK